MLILSAHVEGPTDLDSLCHESARIARNLQVGINVTYEGQTIEVRPSSHPYNLVQTFLRGAARGD